MLVHCLFSSVKLPPFLKDISFWPFTCFCLIGNGCSGGGGIVAFIAKILVVPCVLVVTRAHG